MPEGNTLYISQKRALKAVLVTLYIGFIVTQLLRLEAVDRAAFPIFELLYGLFAAVVVALPLLLINYWTLFSRYRKSGRKEKWTWLAKGKATMVMASLVAMGAVFVYQTGDVTTYGTFEVEQKVREEDRYYILLADQRLSVTFNEYQLIEEGESYALGFRWNKNVPDRGELWTIVR
ncbi:hypothetical protein [Halobacillus salinus]|uniref:Uncharacterized protein n=1 Tax=Halobacillus salinus TaxID=192814 RepID=A0A4Z0GUE3_9BACI|nr:hypothetical protein [Halobacillus salinus]TGB00749.1 hypothetical protein E4663_19225 [Halobacillus salinus]